MPSQEWIKKRLYARIALFDRAWFLGQLPRLLEANNYSERMKKAGVPDKVRRKILRRWRPLPYALRKEMEGLIKDMRRRTL